MVTIDALIRTKRKSIAISISPQGNLVVRAPERCPLSYIQKLVDSKADWINLQRQKCLKKLQSNIDLFEYKQVMFCGDCYKVVLSNSIKKPIIYNEQFVLPFKTKPEKVQNTIAKWLKECSYQIIENRLQYFATLMQLSPESLSLNNAKQIWGVCSKKNEIKINWRCIMLPPDLLDYVIVHELSHMLEFNHSKNFWNIVKSILPDMKTRKDALKKGSYLLQLFR